MSTPQQLWKCKVNINGFCTWACHLFLITAVNLVNAYRKDFNFGTKVNIV